MDKSNKAGTMEEGKGKEKKLPFSLDLNQGTERNKKTKGRDTTPKAPASEI